MYIMELYPIFFCLLSTVSPRECFPFLFPPCFSLLYIQGKLCEPCFPTVISLMTFILVVHFIFCKWYFFFWIPLSISFLDKNERDEN